MDAGVIGILIAHLGAFGSGELINRKVRKKWRGEEYASLVFPHPIILKEQAVS